jgi:hypothetical protein
MNYGRLLDIMRSGVLQNERPVTYYDSVLNANKNLDFVKRMYEKNTPSIQIKGQEGRSTHFMENVN